MMVIFRCAVSVMLPNPPLACLIRVEPAVGHTTPGGPDFTLHRRGLNQARSNTVGPPRSSTPWNGARGTVS